MADRTMTAIDIEYCVPCGLLDRAQEVQTEILETYGQRVDEVSLVTGDSGVFTVAVDGDVVFDTDDEGYDLETILSRVDEQVAATA